MGRCSGSGTRQTEEGVQTARIDKSLAPTATDQLVRLGEPCDGGYVVDKRSVAAADLLISLGIGETWAFEAACLDINSVPLHAYDASVGLRRYGVNLISALSISFGHQSIRRRARLFLSYLGFFRQQKHHHPLMVGRDMPPNEVTLEHVFRTHAIGAGKQAFVKIDIEGSEYFLLEALIGFAPHITGLAIEFHDVEAHQAEIIDFVSRFELNVAHVHCNNFEGLGANGCPEVIEVSFTRSPADTENPPVLPGRLDRPNNPTTDDYRIEFI